MLPEYKNVKNDLETLKNNITAIRNEFGANVKPDGLSEKAKTAYDEVIRKMDLLEETLNKLINEPKADWIDRSLNWDSVKGTLYGFNVTGFPNANEGGKDEVSALTGIFNNDDDMRVIWSTCRKLSGLAHFTDQMEDAEKLEDHSKSIDEYNAAKEAYEKELDSVTEPFAYRDYGAMLEERNRQAERMNKIFPEYDAYNKGGYIEKLNREYESFKAVKLAEKAALINERSPYAIRSLEIKKELASLEEEIAESFKHADFLEKPVERDNNLTIAKNNDAIVEMKERIKEIDDYNSRSANERAARQAKADSDAKTIDKYRTQVPGKQDDTGMMIVIEQRKKFIAIRDRIDDLLQLKAELARKVSALGFGKMSPDELRSAVKEGKTFAPFKDKIIAVEALKKIDLAESMTEFIKKYKEIYHPSAEMASSIDANIIDPFDLNKLIDKSVKGLENDAAAMLDPKPDAPELKGADINIVRYNLESIDTAYNEMSVLRNTVEASAEAEEKLMDESRALSDKIKELEAENVSLANNVDRYYTLKAGRLLKKKEDLIKEKEECDAKTAEYDAKAKNIDKECAEQYEVVDDHNKKYDRLKRNYEDAEKCHAKAVADIEKYEKIASLRSDCLNKANALKKDLAIDARGEMNKDVFAESRSGMADEMRRFYNTRNCGRKSKHDDSTEYKNMIGAIEDLLGEGEYRRAKSLNADEFKEKLIAVNAAAAEYIRLKNREWSRFVKASTQRKARLDFAAKLCDFTDDCKNTIEKQAAKLEELKNSLNGRELNHVIVSAEKDKVSLFDKINDKAEEKVKAAKKIENEVKAINDPKLKKGAKDIVY